MKRMIALVLTPVLAFAPTACGGDGKDSGSAMPAHSTAGSAPATGQRQSGQHNDQDVMFAQMMIPHHRQAIDMAKTAGTRTSRPEVKKLAADIERAQDPEIRQMTGWLTGWGKPVPAPGMGGMEGMDHGGADGMMSGQDMKKLERLSGTAYDKMFLDMMIEHHQGAVTMAKKEQGSGRFPAATTLAGSIVTSQTAEITTMRDLLKKM